MADFHYIVHATKGDNVGVVQADSKQAALAQLDTIYTPNESLRKSDLISFELVDQKTYESEKERIAAERLAEAIGS
jgi:hypothetical protein